MAQAAIQNQQSKIYNLMTAFPTLAAFLAQKAGELTTIARRYEAKAKATDSPTRRAFCFTRAEALRREAARYAECADHLASRQPKPRTVAIMPGLESGLELETGRAAEGETGILSDAETISKGGQGER